MKLSLESTMTRVDTSRSFRPDPVLNEAVGTVWRNHLNWETAHRKSKGAVSTDYFSAERVKP